MCGQGCSEERAGRGDVAAWGDEHVDDLAMLIDGSIDVLPFPGEFDVGLVNKPTTSDSVATEPGGIGQQRCEALDPPMDRDVIHFDAWERSTRSSSTSR